MVVLTISEVKPFSGWTMVPSKFSKKKLATWLFAQICKYLQTCNQFACSLILSKIIEMREKMQKN